MPRPLSPDKLLARRLEAAATPLVVFDTERRIIFANSALGQWLGIDPESLLHQRCDYHAGGDDPLATIAAGLCPPPEAFSGKVSDGFLSRATHGDQSFDRRPARFVLIDGPEPAATLLVAIVLPAMADDPATLPKTPATADLHGLLQRARADLGKRYHISQLIGVSEPIKSLREQIRVAADAQANVLLVGPRGSGREHIARTVHHAAAPSALPLTPIACPLLDAEQMQALLTKALRHKEAGPNHRPAILLLDVDRLRKGAQQELAGFLKLPGVALRTLATARAPLARLAAKRRFRADLAFALSTLTLSLPPVRRRPEDIPLLAQHFLEEANAAGDRQFSGFQLPALELLARLPWAGNIDQLAQAVREACQRAAGTQIGLSDLPDWVHLAGSARRPEPKANLKLDEFLANIEKELLTRALRVARGNKSKAATLLGLTRPRLLRRLAQLGILEPASADEPVLFEQLPDEP